jgi:hypothetical protein
VQAYKWLMLSGARSSGDDRWGPAAALLELAETMTPEAIRDARRQAREWTVSFEARDTPR